MAQPATILDLKEQRFPLDLKPQMEDIRQLWDAAHKTHWDPNTDIPWHLFDASKYSREQLEASRLYWSRRAWTEYTGTAEFCALQMRLCMEKGREIDARIQMSMEQLEESRHCIASYMFAEQLGGYINEPPTPLPKSINHRGIREKAFDLSISFEAIAIAHICIGETIAAHIFEARYRHTTDPVAKELVLRIMKDEQRHIAFGWRYMAHKVKNFTPELIKDMERVAIDVVENSELKGFHCIWLHPSAETKELIESNNLCAEAGLGACTPEQETETLVKSIGDIRVRLAEWGINLPIFNHDVLGKV
ncbi:ferritin-like domain-containing protein [Lacisediminimonas sp.]|uniref:ferritin-like domain-containing protein n=1 Tax=Lacisediminimonas sp. TaxID=3060582 RepID=UPI00271FB910|nr:ferritin-like domain-containing protein [Lacisediminimonas sp.]MDO8299851.1 ferritin-like domain-containing protein [Lacisediminimonas sp.]